MQQALAQAQVIRWLQPSAVNIMALHDLVFSDLFVGPESSSSWFRPTPDSATREEIPAADEAELNDLRVELDKHSGSNNFRIKWGDENPLRLRVERKVAADNLVIYICRRFNLAPGPLNKLGMPRAVAEKLLDDKIKDGLVVFLGPTGSGKSTTAASYIHDRLETHGGVCWTVESPIELPLQGQHGKGICYQTEVDSDSDIGTALTSLYRSSPNIIFIGEVKDTKTAKEAITAALGGHLVIITFHANDLITGLGRLTRMAEDESANIGLADALKVAMHLKLNTSPIRTLPGEAGHEVKGTGTPERFLQVEPLWMEGDLAQGLRSIIKNSDPGLLKSEIERQRRNLMIQRSS